MYGGKIVAALSRQHPRDLFDCRDISIEDFFEVKAGFMLSLLGSDKPIVECLFPNPIDQHEALQNILLLKSKNLDKYKEGIDKLIRALDNK